MKHIVATCISQRTLQRPMRIESLRGTKWRWNLNSHFVVSVVLRTCTTASQLLNEAAKTHVSVIPLQTKANLKPWQLFLLLLEIWHVKRHCLGCWNIEILIWGYQISKTKGGQGFNETPSESPNLAANAKGRITIQHYSAFVLFVFWQVLLFCKIISGSVNLCDAFHTPASKERNIECNTNKRRTVHGGDIWKLRAQCLRHICWEMEEQD